MFNLEATVGEPTTQDQEPAQETLDEGQVIDTPDSDAPSNGEGSPETKEVPEYDIDGTKYKADVLKAALESHTNKEKWQKEFTQKTQEIAAERKKYKDFDQQSKDLEDIKQLRDTLRSDPELFRRIKKVEREWQDERESDPDWQTKQRDAERDAELAQLKQRLDAKDNEFKSVMIGTDLALLERNEGLTKEETEQVRQEYLNNKHANVDAAYWTVFKDRILQKTRQQAERDALDKKRLGVEVKKGKTTNAAPAPKNDGRIPDYEDWMQQNRGKSLQDYLNVYAKT